MFKAYKKAFILIAAAVLASAYGCKATDALDDGDSSKKADMQLVFDGAGGLWQDGDAQKTLAQNLNTPVKLPSGIPSKEGFVFVGFYRTAQSDIDPSAQSPQNSVNGDTLFTEDLTKVYALYRENAPEGSYTVAFKLSENGEEIKAIIVTEGNPIPSEEIPASPSRPFYTRDGTDWYTASDAVYDMSSTVSSNLVLFPKWLGYEFLVVFDASGGTIDGENVKEYKLTYPASLPDTLPTPVHSALAFSHWNTSNLDVGTAPSAGSVTEDAVYYAIWTLPESGIGMRVDDNEKPWEGAVVPITIPSGGWYRIELWGGQGGPAGTGNPANYFDDYNGEDGTGFQSGGKGAYTSGHIYLRQNDKILLYIGGARIVHDTTSSGGGFNGGGSGYTSGAGAGDGAGGGATDVRVLGESLAHRIMVAAGGGGAADGRLSSSGINTSAMALWKGGYGGGTASGGNGDGGFPTGVHGSYAGDPGYGAQLNAGGQKPINAGQSGTWGYGGNARGAAESYGGGGGGWFGGGSGGQWYGNGGGGGGSSYISGMDGFIACDQTSTDTPMPPTTNTGFDNPTGGFVPHPNGGSISWTGYSFTHGIAKAGNEEMPSPENGTEIGHRGPGTARITYLGTVDVDDE